MQWMPGRVKTIILRCAGQRGAKGHVFLYDRASALILVLYITIGITLEGKGASVPVLENDLFSDVAAASCNLWQPLVGCNIISYLMQTWVLLQYHML